MDKTLEFMELDPNDPEDDWGWKYKSRRLEFIGKSHRFMLWFDEDRREPHGWNFVSKCDDEVDNMSLGAIPEEFIDSLYEWIKWYKNE